MNLIQYKRKQTTNVTLTDRKSNIDWIEVDVTVIADLKDLSITNCYVKC